MIKVYICIFIYTYLYIYIYPKLLYKWFNIEISLTYAFMGGHSNCALGPPSLRMQAYDKAKEDPNIKHPCQHVAKMNLPGFFRCCVFRWKKQREAQKWGLLCQACPHLAKKYKEPPNVLRKIIGHSLKFQHRAKSDGGSSLLPPEFETAIASCIVPRTDVELQWCINDYIYIYFDYIYI